MAPIEYIDMIDGYVKFEDGMRLPIVRRFDANGGELEPDDNSPEVDAILVGPSPMDEWIHIYVEPCAVN